MVSDARRRAEEALVFMAAALRDDIPPLPSQVRWLADSVRALLASEPAKAPFVSRNEEWGLRPDFTTAGVTAPPAGAEVREAAEANDDCEVPGVCRACTPLVNEEISRWQARIEEVITRAGLVPYDASGNESGDPLDYSADQIEVALGASAALRGGQKGGGR